MIHIAIGTKAQVIKMSPVMRALKERNIAFNLVDLGQHALITRSLRDEFEIKDPDVCLSEGENVSSLSGAISWVWRILSQGLSPLRLREKIFLGRKGVCLIHGDTASTLLGLYLAKMAGLKVAHIESGLRSNCLIEPLPEEMVRIAAMKFSDILFAPSEWAFDNLKRMGLGEKSVLLPSNTGKEAALFSLARKAEFGLAVNEFCLFTCHRIENIFSKRRMRFILELIRRISSQIPLVFVLHPPTLKRLEFYGLWKELENMPGVHFLKILSHSQFIRLVDKSSFVVTDGGSIQEEAFYLGRPCLLLRNCTERNEGLGQNVVLSGFDSRLIGDFLKGYPRYLRPRAASGNCASAAIIERLTEYA